MKDTQAQAKVSELYEARVTILLSPPSNLRVVGTGGAQTGGGSGNPPPKPTGSLKYYKDGVAIPDETLTVFESKQPQLKFSLYGPDGKPMSGDLVVISQFSAPDSSRNPKHRQKSPFNDGNSAAIYFRDQEINQGNGWSVNLHRHGEPNDAYFEFCLIALCYENAVAVNIDPSIIINP